MGESGALGRKVSVIIPTYNRANLLRPCLGSVLKQTHFDLEAIVIDDGSTDETAAFLNETARTDSRLRVLSQNRKGAQVARNMGFAEATGEFVSFLDDDDLWHPEKIRKELEAFHPEIDGVICQTVWFREWPGDHNFLFNVFDGRDYLARFLKLDVVWQTAAPLWRKTFLAQVGPWDARLTSGQDLDFHTRCLCFQPKIKVLPDVLNFFREHAGVRITKDKKEEHPANALVAMRNAYELLKARDLMTEERGLSLATTLMRQSRTLALYGEGKLADECLRIALDVHPSRQVRRAIRRFLWPMNRLILASRRAKPVARALRKASQLSMYKLKLEDPRVPWWQVYPYENSNEIKTWGTSLVDIEGPKNTSQ
jgi:hypothetical protein